MRITFLGTPAFALPSLDMLLKSGHELQIFTQPDKPSGRHNTLTPSPVKLFAIEHGIPVHQPEHIKSKAGMIALKQVAPDLMVTVAFGQMLSAENLAVPRFGCINVHASLLPTYRGAAPVHWAIIHGETETGITTMFTEIGMDSGDMLLQDRLTIDPEETSDELSARLSHLGAGTLSRTLTALQQGTLLRIPQDDTKASVCPLLRKEHGRLDFTQSARDVHNRVRGTNSWPGAYALLDGKPLKIWRTRQLDRPLHYSAGLCFSNDANNLLVACGTGAIEVLELQSPGGKRISGISYLRGHPLNGKVLT